MSKFLAVLWSPVQMKAKTLSVLLTVCVFLFNTLSDNRNIPEYTEVRLDRNCYFTAALAAAIEIDEVNLKAAAEKEFKSASLLPYASLTLSLIWLV